ncbi:MAG: trypsin-like serine protease [Treponema sp.]|jgi:S1-C subfamily serine protease|nr:MAG: trypsin-like serine protease [Treponema sp.]
MRLYSRQQVAIIVLVTATLAGAFAFGFGGMKVGSSSTADGNPGKAKAIEAAGTVGTADIFVDAPAEEHFPLKGNPGTLTAAAAGKEEYTQDELQNITVYENANDAVVNITTETVGINWFLEPVPQEGGSGSGSIIDTRGYVVTNTHVISDAVKIYISLSDGSQYEGSVVGTDKENDIAVIKFTPPKDAVLRTIQFGDSDNLKVGQKVLAIGNPFGLERTLTTGIVSALGRPIKTESNTIIKDMIQTDTAINPGNSGGPLLDTKGRMIGINTMIYSTSGSSAGIGFSVPVNTAKRVVSELIQYGKVRRGSIDAELVQLNSAIANYARLSTREGLLVSRVGSGSFAEKAGLRGGTDAVRYGGGRNSSIIYLGGDIITSIAGEPVATLTDYYSALESRKPGETVEVTVLRGRQQISLKLTLAERAN